MTQYVNEENPLEWMELQLRQGERPCLESPDGFSWTYSQFHEISGRLASGLAARGVRQGDRVVAQLEKSPLGASLYWACLRMGAVFVPLNTAYTRPEVEYFLGDSEPRVFVDSETLASLAECRDPSG